MRMISAVLPLVCLAVPLAAGAGSPLPAPPAAAIAQTPEHIALAAKLIEAQGQGRTLDAMLPRLVQILMPHLAIASRRDQMIAIARDTFARRFTDAELQELTAFYQTPTGRKYIDQLPGIMNENMSVSETVGRAAGQAAIPRIIERMRKAHLKVPSAT